MRRAATAIRLPPFTLLSPYTCPLRSRWVVSAAARACVWRSLRTSSGQEESLPARMAITSVGPWRRQPPLVPGMTVARAGGGGGTSLWRGWTTRRYGPSLSHFVREYHRGLNHSVCVYARVSRQTHIAACHLVTYPSSLPSHSPLPIEPALRPDSLHVRSFLCVPCSSSVHYLSRSSTMRKRARNTK